MQKPHAVLIGGSAGALEPLKKIVSGLPEKLTASVFIAIHIDPNAEPMLAEILQKRCKLLIRYPNDEEFYLPSVVYVSPPGHHMLLSYRKVWIFPANFAHMPKPNIDLMLQSAANEFEDKAIAVILSGYGTDGSVGVRSIKEKGGKVIVQSEDTSQQQGMPKAAIAGGMADYVIPPEVIPGTIARLVEGNQEDREQDERDLEKAMEYDWRKQS